MQGEFNKFGVWGLVVFDFRANGVGSGRWVTLGFKESCDVSVVVKFVKTELKAKKICLWGRSMGAASCLFFLSPSFRAHFQKKFPKIRGNLQGTSEMHQPQVDFTKIEAQEARESFYQKKDVTRVAGHFEWSRIEWVDCFVSDASMLELKKTIISLVKSRNSSIPVWLIKAATAVIDREIKKKTSIGVSDIAPIKFAHSIRTPGMLVIGRKVEKNNFKDQRMKWWISILFTNYSGLWVVKKSRLKFLKGIMLIIDPTNLNRKLLNLLLQVLKKKIKILRDLNPQKVKEKSKNNKKIIIAF